MTAAGGYDHALAFLTDTKAAKPSNSGRGARAKFVDNLPRDADGMYVWSDGSKHSAPPLVSHCMMVQADDVGLEGAVVVKVPTNPKRTFGYKGTSISMGSAPVRQGASWTTTSKSTHVTRTWRLLGVHTPQ